jgi:hypothetical protein
MYHQNSEDNSSYDSSRKDQKHLIHQHCLRVEFSYDSVTNLETQISAAAILFFKKQSKMHTNKAQSRNE